MDTDPDDGGWWLLHGTEVVAELDVDEVDQPWFLGRVLPRPGFAGVRPLFDEQEALMRADPRDGEAEIANYRLINATLRLVTPYGPAAEFWLRIQDDRMCLRWSDEPLD